MVMPISLIGAGESEVDDIGQVISTETNTGVFADVQSVSQSEFMSGGQMGLKPDCVFRVWATEYNGQRVVECADMRYAIYRTYNAPDGRVELYAEVRKGDEQEGQD